jgi:2-polyprenyl-6-methoxyphenol hydroxylase-like FAD-dependent oxidoreductase
MIQWKHTLCIYALFQLTIASTEAFSVTPGGESLAAGRPKVIQCVDCAIVGAGPAGLSASIAISKSAPSTSIAVYERDSFQPKGASVSIFPTGWVSLEELDPVLVPRLKKTGTPVFAAVIKQWKGGDNANADAEAVGEGTEEKEKEPTVFAYAHLWHDIRMVLATRAKEIYPISNSNGNDIFHLNSSLVDIKPLELDDETNHNGARFEITVNENGQEKIMQAKFLIACDGTMSKVRSLLPNEPDILIDEKKSVWRGCVPTLSTKGKATMWADKDTERSALIWPAGKDAGASWTVISKVQDGKAETVEEARSRLLSVIDDMDEDFKQVVVDSPMVIENKLHIRDYDKPWKSSYDGLVYVGDSAHPVRPTGQGTALAFEDCKVLSEKIAKYGMSVEALRAYEDERYEPVKAISDAVRQSANESYAKNDRTQTTTG